MLAFICHSLGIIAKRPKHSPPFAICAPFIHSFICLPFQELTYPKNLPVASFAHSKRRERRQNNDSGGTFFIPSLTFCCATTFWTAVPLPLLRLFGASVSPGRCAIVPGQLSPASLIPAEIKTKSVSSSAEGVPEATAAEDNTKVVHSSSPIGKRLAKSHWLLLLLAHAPSSRRSVASSAAFADECVTE